MKSLFNFEPAQDGVSGTQGFTMHNKLFTLLLFQENTLLSSLNCLICCFVRMLFSKAFLVAETVGKRMLLSGQCPQKLIKEYSYQPEAQIKVEVHEVYFANAQRID